MAEDNPKQDAWQRWNDELDLSRKAKGFEQWQTRAKKIIKRYRDERGEVGADSVPEGARFNILWANIQTLMPALYAKSPKPVVERRYLDRDEVGRTASVILERCLSYELDDGSYSSAIKKVVLDRLLPGRGVAWVRYEPKFTPMPGKTQEAPNVDAGSGSGRVFEPTGRDNSDRDDFANGSGRVRGDLDGELGRSSGAQEATSDAPTEQVATESVPVDYIDWQDFRTSPARTWEEVWWVGKRVYMTRKELVKRFGEVGKKPPLDWSPIDGGANASGAAAPDDDKKKRAKVWEIWNKIDRKVVWLAESYKDELLDERADPLGLESFWPVPKPLFATLTNDSLIPIPDYIEYQDQASELDDLTTRISNLTKAIKVAGVYDASQAALKRMFEEGFENELVPCDNMAEFSSKAGANGMGHIWLLPIKDMAATLLTLYDARDRCLQVLFQVTGMSDIVRGGNEGGAPKTATEQRIKGQFASMRLNDMQGEVVRFACDTLRIMGELIAEHFDPMTLFEVSGFEEYAKEQWPPQVPDAPSIQPSPMMGHNGGPSMSPSGENPGGAPPVSPAAPPPAAVGSAPGLAASPPGSLTPPMGMMAPQPSPEQVARAKAADMFKKAVALLRNDKLRGFRIDIETDSIVEPDQQEMQAARTQLMQAISQFLPEAIKAGTEAPELKPLMARLLMFFLRGFKASRDIESAFEQFIDDMTRDAAKPKPPPKPTPDEMKVQIMREQQDGENKRMQAQAAIDQQTAEREAAQKQTEFQMEQQKAQADFALEQKKQQAELQGMREKQQLERDKMEMEMAFEERKLELQMRAQAHVAAVKAASTEHSATMKAKTEKKRADAPVGTA